MRSITSKQKAVVLFSGGLDSTIALARAVRNYDRVVALTFDYGQPNFEEVKAAFGIAKKLGLSDKATDRNLHLFMKLNPMAPHPNGEFMGRNLIFLAYALRCCLCMELDVVVTGACADDAFVDNGLPFFKELRGVFGLFGVAIHTPLLQLTKTDLVRELPTHGIGLDDVYSCRQAGRCGRCKTCRQFDDARKKAFGLEPVQ